MTTKPRATPTATIKQDKSFEVTDETGRKIVYRELDVVEQFDLNRLLGPQDSQNLTVVLQATFVAGTRSINGTPRPFPKDDAELRATMRALDSAGLNAIQTELVERASKAATPAEEDAEIKN